MVCGVWPWGPRDPFFGVQRCGPYIRRRGAATRAGPSRRMSCECGPSCTGAERSPGSRRFIQMLNAFLPGRAGARQNWVRPPSERNGDRGEHVLWAAWEEPPERPLVSLTGR